MKNYTLRIGAGVAFTATALALTATSALASGFSIFEQGTKASGVAGAYSALVNDASANWYNPAAMVWSEGSQLQFGANLIQAGAGTEFTSADPAFGLTQPITFEPDDSIETPVNTYFTKKLSSNIAIGIGVNTPFGLSTSWVDRPVTFSAVDSALVSFVVNPNVAFRLTETWAVAVGVDFILADVKDFSREVPVNLDANPRTFEVIGFSNLSGDGDDIAWNAAVSWRTETASFGLTYRDGFSIDIDGNIDYANFGPIAGFFPSSPGTTVLNLPAQAQIGYGFAMTQNFWLEVDIAWAEWSVFEEIAIDIENNTPFSRDVVIEENWDDTQSYRIGVIWNSGGSNEWRFGAVYDESPVPEEFLRPSIPDANRKGGTIGFSHKGQKLEFDLYYMALTFDDITATGPAADGVIDGTFESFVNLLGFGFNYRF